MFSLLAAWLVRKCDKNFEQPQEFDDPNDTIQKIIDAVKENVSSSAVDDVILKFRIFQGMAIDFPPNKLKQGVGEHVVYILDNLANSAIKKNNIILRK